MSIEKDIKDIKKRLIAIEGKLGYIMVNRPQENGTQIGQEPINLTVLPNSTATISEPPANLQ